jgi:Initiator Replication protein
MSLTASQKTNFDGFPKPGELIEITGAHGLEASDRAILNRLYQLAHDCGNITESEAEWEIPLAHLRPSTHESNDRLRASLERLMRVVVAVPYRSNSGEPRTLMTHLFEFFDLSDNESSTKATVRFGLPRKLRPVIARSNRWGRIKAEVVCAMSSRYAIALYELIQLRAGMHKSVEEFPIDKFRSLLGVPPNTYQRGPDFVRYVLEPAAREVNGLSDMSVQLAPCRRSARSPIESVTVAWWRKEGDEYRAALRERDLPKIGRAARLRGTTKRVEPIQTDLEDLLAGIT